MAWLEARLASFTNPSAMRALEALQRKAVMIDAAKSIFCMMRDNAPPEHIDDATRALSINFLKAMTAAIIALSPTLAMKLRKPIPRLMVSLNWKGRIFFSSAP